MVPPMPLTVSGFTEAVSEPSAPADAVIVVSIGEVDVGQRNRAAIGQVSDGRYLLCHRAGHIRGRHHRTHHSCR